MLVQIKKDSVQAGERFDPLTGTMIRLGSTRVLRGGRVAFQPGWLSARGT